MRILRLIGGAVFVLAFAMTVAAQSGGCGLKPEQIPGVRGLRLGMTAAELKTIYPRLVVGPADEFGQSKVELWQNQLVQVDQAAFKGVSTVRLSLVDDRLVEFGLTYDLLPWKDLNQFATKTSETLGLPAGWKGDESNLTLECGRVLIRAARSSWSVGSMSPYLGFKELGAEEVVAARVAKKKERQIESFKP
ncbi:MAG TPA: hypothetical protein VN256_10705 [Pyrinomonadaceae bacterium]|nr:hypothetical protein [Pyrinomonadaceae bacterium]